ncbi:ectonucleotide pyrophosphatase/phosphodiesterase [Thalassotalea sp. 1_MG-2023]|uniref:alkaline phosphatase family protein n=1 Tax=Thalassotalea sp. 1_MG-2023 TaxID=3062680 RepID=UPI0026E46ECB|nr:ectonucleotide pyrophosphatase/phosphodiesterase [Thalassotalea sp. 1_MG-2023]MDO6428749.1 ectonucleotide pyrophosphatase/phosphodiesterase [Thalassotalea sp. 1_MG-2023]
MFKFSFLLFVACFSSFAQTVNNKNPVILISLDGFSGKYLTKYQPPNLLSMANKGISTDALIPVYPSKTFPNHLTMVTGKSPAEHGIVHNSFYHRSLNKNYTLGSGKHNSAWLTAKPIWTIAEQQGIKTAVYFWPESETKVNNILPSHVKAYKHNTSNKVRLAQLISWLQLPESERPQLLISYISTIDDIGHSHGTKAEQTKNAIRYVDKLLGDFVKKIHQSTSLTPNIIIVSDHGMIDVNQGKKLNIGDLFTPQKNTIVVNGQTQLYMYNDDHEALARLHDQLTKHKNRQHFRSYLAKDFPKHWQLNQQTQATPDMIIEAIPPAIFVKEGKHSPFATHGYDPTSNKDLNAMMIAFGPQFKPDCQIDKLENKYIFHLVASLLSLEKIDSSEVIRPFFKRTP